MCKVKSCDRPDFLGGQCGFHAMQAWVPARRGPAAGAPLHDDAPTRRTRISRAAREAPRQAPRPVSG